VRTHLQAILVLIALILIAPFTGAEGNHAVEWDRYADEGTVEVITTDEDGSARVTKVWLAVVDGQGYVRTGKTRWGGNLERNPELTLRIGETEVPLRVEFVTDPTERDAVKAALRAKHGFSDWILNPIRGRNPKIMRLVPREAQ
jgi:hypothetical protein